jgi:hypothetical protein
MDALITTFLTRTEAVTPVRNPHSTRKPTRSKTKGSRSQIQPARSPKKPRSETLGSGSHPNPGNTSR